MHTLAQSMDITIVDEQNKETSLKYTADQYSYSADPLTIQQIQKHVAQQSGLTIQKNHITRALQFLAPPSDQEIIKPCMLGQHTTAAALYFADYWDVSQPIKQQLGKTMLDNGYMNLACKHLAHTNQISSHAVTSLIPFIKATGTVFSLWPDYIEKKTLKQIYNAMYASDEFQDLWQTLTHKTWFDRCKSWIPFWNLSESADNIELIQTLTTTWKESSITQLFNALYPYQIDKIIYEHFYPSKNSYRDMPRHMFTHIPLISLFKTLAPKPSIWSKDKRYEYSFDNDVILCNQDKKILQKIYNQAHIRLNFSKYQTTLPKIQTLKSCAYKWHFPKAFEDTIQKTIKSCAYVYDIPEVRYKHYHYIPKRGHHIMPFYWPWLKLGSCIVFAGCTMAALYYFYKQIQENIKQHDIYISNCTCYIQEQLMQQAHKDTIPIYKYVIENNYAYNTSFKKAMHAILNTIDQTPFAKPTDFSYQQYLNIKDTIKPLYNDWNTIPSDGIFAGTVKIIPTSLYALMVCSVQWLWFKYGRSRDTGYLYNRARFIIEPLSLLEDILGLNTPQTIIRTDIEILN
jgi:hypothetical protein